MTLRLLQIDETNVGDHWHLGAQDRCFYIWEYTSGRDFSFSQTNDLINNLKKKPTASAAQLRHKDRAIGVCGEALRVTLNAEWLRTATIVPAPPSKSPAHPDYDERMRRVAQAIPHQDVRALVRQAGDFVASHERANQGLNRISLEELLEAYSIDEALVAPPPMRIAILDDVLTNGTHYLAMKTKLIERFPHAEIIGLFIARRVFPTPEAAGFPPL
ncbi:hypothetical protein [Brevundimonas sp.]|uniref:hypothetical protein n=1 Tax=Brevundimonas sp. TaxID=1871086 RepID=UPI0028AE0924|nr:hypothetical protein [Brevundimonas sp.]